MVLEQRLKRPLIRVAKMKSGRPDGELKGIYLPQEYLLISSRRLEWEKGLVAEVLALGRGGKASPNVPTTVWDGGSKRIAAAAHTGILTLATVFT